MKYPWESKTYWGGVVPLVVAVVLLAWAGDGERVELTKEDILWVVSTLLGGTGLTWWGRVAADEPVWPRREREK